MHDLQKYHYEAWTEFLKFKSGVLINMLEQLLTKGMKQGYIRTDIDVKIIARMRVSQIEFGFNTEIFPVSEFSTVKVQMQFLEHFNYGICTLKGYKLLNQYQNKHDE